MPELIRVNAFTPYDEIKKEAYEWYQIDENAARALCASFDYRVDECISFAKSINLHSPADFCAKVFVLATGEFPEKVAIEKTIGERKHQGFVEFVEGFAGELQKLPVDAVGFVRRFGKTKDEVVRGIRDAVSMARDSTDLVIALNSVAPEFGKMLFSAWLLKERGIDASLFLNAYIGKISALRRRIGRIIAKMFEK